MLGTDVTVALGTDLGVGPGDRVCVSAGPRPFLRIQGFRGTAAEPVTVLNCEGLVEIRNPDRAYALVIEGASEHVRITGTGVAGLEHGFRVSAPAREPYPGIGVWILGRATDIEVDHMEVFDTGFAGVMAKTDPTNCTLAERRRARAAVQRRDGDARPRVASPRSRSSASGWRARKEAKARP